MKLRIAPSTGRNQLSTKFAQGRQIIRGSGLQADPQYGIPGGSLPWAGRKMRCAARLAGVSCRSPLPP